MTLAPASIAALRSRLVLERAATAADGTVAWTAAATLWAALSPTSDGEAERGAALAGRTGWRIECRWRDDLTSADRLRRGTRIFRILAVRDLDQRRRRLAILAEEETP
ncbi:phage head closure protein [Siculibacillus lacustris]|uniref:phage head closure protein n=1 Tax=Siculibacillus lacustris TaxID=1549641 RepID=UPI001D17F431|nr:phage head closure protein [Siculibacillus lacustris]